jgi:hypothetical protein
MRAKNPVKYVMCNGEQDVPDDSRERSTHFSAIIEYGFDKKKIVGIDF